MKRNGDPVAQDLQERAASEKDKVQKRTGGGVVGLRNRFEIGETAPTCRDVAVTPDYTVVCIRDVTVSS